MSSNRRAESQRGYALLLMMVAMTMATLAFLVPAAGNARLDRDDVTRRALAEAKQALIGYAVLASQGPGHFVCPDFNNDGDSEGGCTGTVGRLPWKTLRMPELRDGSGERLWYAVSDNFINESGNPVNSDTQGKLTVNGLAADQVIAVVFAPGAPLAGQNRNTDAEIKNIRNFLEGANADEMPDKFESKIAGANFNDQMVIIRAEDVFPIVENAVATRLNKEIVPLLNYYRDSWSMSGKSSGFYPYARTFADAHVQGGAAAAECGTASQTQGVIPPQFDCDPPTNNIWDGGVTITLGSGTYGCDKVTLSEEDKKRIVAWAQCEILFTGAQTVSIETSWVKSAAISLIGPEPRFTITHAGVTKTWEPNSFSTAVNANKDIKAIYGGTLPSGSTPANSTLKISIPVYRLPQRIAETQDIQTDWFFNNGWYRQTWYAVSEARTPATPAACVAGTNCLVATGYGGVENNKQALLVLAGRALSAVPQPAVRTGLKNEYFEGLNVDINDQEFKSARSIATFNDKLVVVAP